MSLLRLPCALIDLGTWIAAIFYCALFRDNSTQTGVGWRLLSGKELDNIFGGRGLTIRPNDEDLGTCRYDGH